MSDKSIKISVITFCQYHQIEPDFVYALQESGLLDLQKEKEELYLLNQQIDILEKYIRMHYELGINIEGLEVITRLLTKMEEMQAELNLLKRRFGE
ncbi:MULTISPECIES: chaperone modulator CbpM [Flavobacterium]|uniref:chaperone modulator CbpM n=1 Tax=Flavobacterium TaxID=237 RepID=UPI001FCAC499|nr:MULTISPECIES: chaperone modulator CbpM [Flavobacterium]UOK41482.1 chaperone modulator CbpM [Flavobacterium enshiense]